MLKRLQAEGLDLSAFWTAEEFATLFAEPAVGLTDESAVVEPAATDIVRGDLFALGPHRLLCGDATSAADVTRLLDGATPNLMATDPPYGVDYDPAWRHRANPSQRTTVGRVLDCATWLAAWRLFLGAIAYVWCAALKASTVAADRSVRTWTCSSSARTCSGTRSCAGRFAVSACARRMTASGAGRRPESQVRNVSSAIPRAVAHSAWDRPSCVRISRKADVASIGHDDAIGSRPHEANGWR